VTNGMSVELGHVYVMPPNTRMTIVAGVLNLTPRSDDRGPHMPIDHFLRSLAQDLKSRAIGVILSGSASDGALGLRAIKAEGGFSGASAVQRPAVERDQVFQGCGRVPDPGAERFPDHHQAAAGGRADPHLGARVCDGRGSLLAGHRAARVAWRRVRDRPDPAVRYRRQ